MLLDYPSIDDEQHAFFFEGDDYDMFRSQENLYPTGNYDITQQQQAQYPGVDYYNTINSESRSPQQQMLPAWTPTSGSSGAMPDWQRQVSMASYMQATNQPTNRMAQYGETDEYSGLCTVAQAINRAPNAMSHHQWMRSTTYRFNPSTGKTRTKDKYRVVYTDHQRLELEKEFRFSRYITIRRKSELASSLGLSERQVKIWFQNRRAKERKQAKKQGVPTPDAEPKQDARASKQQTMCYPMEEVEYPEQKEMAQHLSVGLSYRMMDPSTTVIKVEPISNQSRSSCLKSL